MAGLNKVLLMGNLGRDPEVRFTTGGQSVANFSIATNETWKDKNGQVQEKTEWHKIVVWGKLAELCGEYLKKGRQAFIKKFTGLFTSMNWRARVVDFPSRFRGVIGTKLTRWKSAHR